MAEVILYTGPDCHLCDLAKDILYPLVAEYDLKLQLVDISQQDILQQRYGFSIPVLKLENGVEKNWPFTAGQVRKLLQALP